MSTTDLKKTVGRFSHINTPTNWTDISEPSFEIINKVKSRLALRATPQNIGSFTFTHFDPKTVGDDELKFLDERMYATMEILQSNPTPIKIAQKQGLTLKAYEFSMGRKMTQALLLKKESTGFVLATATIWSEFFQSYLPHFVKATQDVILD